MRELDVYEPLIAEVQIIKTASESASVILKIDDIIAEEMSDEKKGI
jgi:chaperonin GroEL (HSP60 family)